MYRLCAGVNWEDDYIVKLQNYIKKYSVYTSGWWGLQTVVFIWKAHHNKPCRTFFICVAFSGPALSLSLSHGNIFLTSFKINKYTYILYNQCKILVNNMFLPFRIKVHLISDQIRKVHKHLSFFYNY